MNKINLPDSYNLLAHGILILIISTSYLYHYATRGTKNSFFSKFKLLPKIIL